MSRLLRILLVDDNPDDRGLVERELRKEFPNVQILEAIDQTQLDGCIEQGGFDLVVTDYHLLWSDGIQVLKAVKHRWPHCPVIMFTGTGTQEIAVEAMKHGLDDYIIKTIPHLVRLRGAARAALEHATTQKRADELASRLESLLAQLRVGIFSCSPDGSLLALNFVMRDYLQNDFGVDMRSLAELFPSEQDARKFLEDLVTTGEPNEREIECVTDANEVKCYRLNARLVSTRGRDARIDGLLEDITGRKQLETEAHEAAIAAAQVKMLSPRERQVFHLVATGKPNKSIASGLDISIKTVEVHRSNLMRKLRLKSFAELVRLATMAERSDV